MTRIKHNILTESKASSSFRFSPLNVNKIIFAGHTKAENMSRRYK